MKNSNILNLILLSFLFSASLTLIWVGGMRGVGGGKVGNFTPPPVGFPLITQKR